MFFSQTFMNICMACYRSQLLRAVQLRQIYYLSCLLKSTSSQPPSKRSNSKYFACDKGVTVLSNLFTQKQPLLHRHSNTYKQERYAIVANFTTSAIRLALSSSELKKTVDKLTDQFMEAREMLQDARESMGTVYFSDDMEEAQAAVKDTLKQYKDLLSQLSEEQGRDVLRTIGLKMEELKAQEQALKDSLQDDH